MMNAIHKFLTGLVPAALLLGAAPGNGSNDQSASGTHLPVAELQQQVIAWATSNGGLGEAGQRLEIKPAKMDSRLVFQRCSEPLAFEYQQNSARATRTLVKVRCTGEQPWAVYVPLEILRYQRAVVTRQPLLRDQPITAEDIELQEVALKGSSQGWYRSLESVQGMIAKRSLRAGHALGKHDLKQAQLIKRGDEVVIVANTGSVTVKMHGTALANGYLNQQIEVRNTSSRRTIKAVVTDVGKVRAIM